MLSSCIAPALLGSIRQHLSGVCLRPAAAWATHLAGQVHSHSYSTAGESGSNSGQSQAAVASSKPAAAQVNHGPDAGGLHVTVEPLQDKYEGVSVVSLTRPEAKNSIGRRLLRELREAVNLLRQERTTRCVVLRSAVPGIFCAGADLKERATMTQAETIEFVTILRRAMSELQALPMPTIAAVDGHALGGGAELALAADIRVAGHGAEFAFPEARLGIIPGAGGTQRLPRLLGGSMAKELIFTGRRVKAEEAKSIGLIDHLAPANGAYDRALEIAAEIAKSAPLSLRMAKAAINHGVEVDLSTGLLMAGAVACQKQDGYGLAGRQFGVMDSLRVQGTCKAHVLLQEEAYYAQLVPTRDRLEGLKAFAEKRAPVYRGE